MHIKFSKNLAHPPQIVVSNTKLEFPILDLMINIGLFVLNSSYLEIVSFYEKIKTNTQIKIYLLKKENIKEGKKLEEEINKNPLLSWNYINSNWQNKKEKRKMKTLDKKIENKKEIKEESEEDKILKDLFEMCKENK